LAQPPSEVDNVKNLKNIPINPCIVFCTTCKGRLPHIQLTLPANLSGNADYANAKFVVLDYNSPDNLADYIRQNYQAELNSGRLLFYQYREAVQFRMAHAKNMSHRLGILNGADILVNMDADNYTGTGFAAYIAEQFTQAKEDIFLWAKMVKSGDGRMPRGISGRIVASRHAFLNVGGYDEKYETHSPDDKDFNARLRRLGYVGLEIDAGYLKAIPHNDKMRYREYPHAATTVAEEDFRIDRGTTVVNYGNIGCGTVWKNFQSEPQYLDRLPTRIFGIGMHKTGTTSLHAALSVLGFKSWHWDSAHSAKAIWREMNSTGRSSTLEKYYALTDLPIPILYRKLDAAYPGSKFILTTRNEKKWLESVRKHWDRAYNRFRDAWDTDPFTHQIHEVIYKQREFEPTLFLERFRRHNSDVLEYFKDRPNDLLVMNIDKNPGWEELAGFLKMSPPQGAYPVRYKTDKKQGQTALHHHHHHRIWNKLLKWIIKLILKIIGWLTQILTWCETRLKQLNTG